MSNLKAVRLHSYGGSDVVSNEDAPRPILREGEVLVRVACSTVNPFDCALHAGYLSSYFNHTLPSTLGTDVSVLAYCPPGGPEGKVLRLAGAHPSSWPCPEQDVGRTWTGRLGGIQDE